MNELLHSLRSDLLSRRMLPFAVLSLVALVAALGYALTAGGSAQAPIGGAAASGAAQPAALAVAAAPPNPNAAESETPGGARYQSGGPTRNPFTPLSEPQSSVSPSPSSKASVPVTPPNGVPGGGESNGGVTGKPGTGGGSGSEPPTPPKPSKPVKKSRFPYDVSILFGQLPATAGQEVTLPPYQNLQPQRPLPSPSNERIALERVNPATKTAVFTLLSPAILRGQGVCLPSPSECQHLGLKPGQAEELEYLEETGQPIVYELKTVSIVKSSSQTAG
jgi:hypothetical protein